MSPGNFLALILKLSPTGEKHKINFIFCCIYYKKYPVKASKLSATPFPLASFLRLLIIASTSSLGKRSAIHPELRISLIGIKKDSYLIYESVIMKQHGIELGLAIFL
jgi:hypothetical protein